MVVFLLVCTCMCMYAILVFLGFHTALRCLSLFLLHVLSTHLSLPSLFPSSLLPFLSPSPFPLPFLTPSLSFPPPHHLLHPPIISSFPSSIPFSIHSPSIYKSNSPPPIQVPTPISASAPPSSPTTASSSRVLMSKMRVFRWGCVRNGVRWRGGWWVFSFLSFPSILRRKGGGAGEGWEGREERRHRHRMLPDTTFLLP